MYHTHMSQSYRVLIVGVGSIGERHLRCFSKTGRVTTGLCEVNEKLRTEVAARYGVTAAHASLDDALAAGYDAAVVATPAPLHIPMATRLAQAGIHLLIEKPLSLSLDGVDELRTIVADQKLTVAIGYTWRAHPMLQRMKDALAEGRFGKPLHLVASTGQHFPTFRPAYRQTYYTKHSTGGGAIQDAITHVLNAGEWLVGPINKLVADASNQYLEGVEVEDTVNIITRQGDVMGSYSLNQFQAANEYSITVKCDRGMCRMEVDPIRWSWCDGPQMPWNTETMEPLERDTMYIRQAEAFLDAIDGLREPLCSLDEGIQTLRANIASLESTHRGAWCEVNTPVVAR